MAERLQKLRPDRDLQCFFERPSAIAAISNASGSGFRVSGSWRQQFDWAVIEWNRDNTFEHPMFRYLPDGDLSGLRLQYDETRSNCIAVDSDLYATVDWPSLRLWVEDDVGETVYKVPLVSHATPVEGSYACATATFALSGTPVAGEYVEVAWLDEHYTHLVAAGDTVNSVVNGLAGYINGNPAGAVRAEAAGSTLALTYVGDGETGANGNRFGAYANATGSGLTWSPAAQTFNGGMSPVKWHFDLEFSDLWGSRLAGGEWIGSVKVPTNRVRKMRWTYAAELQAGAFSRSEFEVVVSNWSVSGTGREYRVAGPQSRRIEDDDPVVVYGGSWQRELGNYSGGSIRKASGPASVTVRYRCAFAHHLYLGTRRVGDSARCEVRVDGAMRFERGLALPGEDVLVRLDLGEVAAGEREVVFNTTGAGPMYFDFLEIAVPTLDLPALPTDSHFTLATDWDTDHSLALAPERTAWIQRSLGFIGPANHYVGALVFYELEKSDHSYASAQVEFSGTPEFSVTTVLEVGAAGARTAISHLNLMGDTAESIAKSFELLLNNGFTQVRAVASGNVLTIYARAMGEAGNQISIAVTPASGDFHGTISGRFDALSGNWFLDGGSDGYWRTDLTATPRINRACRDWSRSYYSALAASGISVTAAFSTEIQHGDPSAAAGIAQRYPDSTPVIVATPALQTNFSPVSIAYWREVYRDMAAIMTEAGVPVSLQFGEIQWWYFAKPGIGYGDTGGMPFYDEYTTSEFAARYGRALPVFMTPFDDPAGFGEETEFLAGLIGEYTDTIAAYVRAAYPSARFEVLYPLDVNEPPLNGAVNFPVAHWTAAKLNYLKTENFGFTFDRDLNKARMSVEFPIAVGFARSASSHLVGVGDYTSPWLKELHLCRDYGLRVGVIWALDQLCLIGYCLPLDRSAGSAQYQG
jgi:hypothetical protein